MWVRTGQLQIMSYNSVSAECCLLSVDYFMKFPKKGKRRTFSDWSFHLRSFSETYRLPLLEVKLDSDVTSCTCRAVSPNFQPAAPPTPRAMTSQSPITRTNSADMKEGSRYYHQTFRITCLFIWAKPEPDQNGLRTRSAFRLQQTLLSFSIQKVYTKRNFHTYSCLTVNEQQLSSQMNISI